MIVIEGTLKIMDFGGCSIDGSEATTAYHWCTCYSTDVSVRTEIFAFGCAAYQILSGHSPYSEYKDLEDRSRIVKDLYGRGQFPSLEGLSLGDVIEGCWSGTFENMGQVVRALENAQKRGIWAAAWQCVRWIGVGSWLPWSSGRATQPTR